MAISRLNDLSSEINLFKKIDPYAVYTVECLCASDYFLVITASKRLDKAETISLLNKTFKPKSVIIEQYNLSDHDLSGPEGEW